MWNFLLLTSNSKISLIVDNLDINWNLQSFEFISIYFTATFVISTSELFFKTSKIKLLPIKPNPPVTNNFIKLVDFYNKITFYINAIVVFLINEDFY